MTVPVINEKSTTLNNDRPTLIATSKLINAEVRNGNDHKLGNLKKLIIDAPRGEIIYGIIAYGGIWGMGEKFAAVPWKSLTFNKKTQLFSLNLEIDDLVNVPSFDNDSWPDMSDIQWVNKVDDFYNRSVKQ